MSMFTLWTRVFAVIGLLLVFERSASWYQWRSGNDSEHSFSAISGLGGHLGLDFFNTSTHTSPGTSAVRKSLVVASIRKEHTKWIDDAFPDWEIKTYVADDPHANYTVFRKDGREASVYLTYIINHYWDLPDYMVFIHAQRYQWHNDDPMYDGMVPLKNLRLAAIDDHGYISLRCAQFPGCPIGVEPKMKGDDTMLGWSREYARVFKDFFPKRSVPKVVSAPCCAQFAVSKAQVMARSVAEYERYREYLWHNTIGGGRSGRIFEYLWHVIFGKEAVFCPPAEECYCQSFGLCDLKCPNKPFSCEGRFRMPPWDSPMNKNWPREGQGIKHWPRDKWWEEWYPPSEYEDFHLRRNVSRETT